MKRHMLSLLVASLLVTPMKAHAADGFVMQQGKMMIFKDGQTMPLDQEIMMTDGTKVMLNGTVMCSDGKKIKLLNGIMIDMNGIILPLSDKVARAVDIARNTKPHLAIDGEMHADTALSDTKLSKLFPFNRLEGSANVLVFPDLGSGNIAYKLVEQLGGVTAVSPL